MKILHNLENFSAERVVATVGTFDGLHLGHQKILNLLKAESVKCSGTSVVFTFAQHPRLILDSDSTHLKLLSTLDEKIHLFEKLGIDILILYPFTKDFAKNTADEFISKFLVEKLHIQTLIVGYDHHFGKERQGEKQNIEHLADKYQFNIINVDPLQIDNINVSSTKIRNDLHDGNMTHVNRMLGYSYNITGLVVEGKKLGRQLGFPTANIEVFDKLKQIPANGVYAVTIQIGTQLHKGMLNIGTRPTVNADTSEKTIETHIFNFNQNIYNQQLTVFFIARLRNEMAFENVELLKYQLAQDMQIATKILYDY